MNEHLSVIAKRVQDGTVSGGVNLCPNCRVAQIRVNALTGRTETRCEAMQGKEGPQLVRGPVAQCNRFIEVGKLNLYEMGEIAWIVEARGKHIGFLSPEELQRRKNQQEVAPTTPGFSR